MARDVLGESRVDPPGRTSLRPSTGRRGARRRRSVVRACRWRDLRLPKTETRQAVTARDRVYHLRESEARALAVVGTFRVVPERELTEGLAVSNRADLRSLAEQGLIARTSAIVNHEPTSLVVLTRAGKALLDG